MAHFKHSPRFAVMLAALLLCGVSVAEETVPTNPEPSAVQIPVHQNAPTSPEPSATPPSTHEHELEARIAELEKKVAELAKPTDTTNPRPIATSPIDPELELAAEQDASHQASETTKPPASSTLAKMNPDISFILDVGGAWYNHANHFQQGGHAIGDNGLTLQGLELAASTTVDPYFRFDTFFQLTEAEVEEAYLTTLSLPWNLQARAGLMNAMFGRQNALHLHSWSFANPPLSHTRFMSPEHFRGPGFELSVLLPLPWYVNLLGQAFGTTADLGFNSRTFGSSEVNKASRIEGLQDLLYLGRIENFFELSTNWSLLVGASESLGQSPHKPDGRTYLHGGDLYLKWRPISTGQGDVALALTVEYILRDSALEHGRLRDHGGYAQFEQQLTKRWMTALRFDTTSLGKSRSPDLETVPGWQRRGSASITFMPSHFSKLRLQGDLSKERDREGLQTALFLQAEVSAGEHGAHKF
jgi:hypothetical protein